MRLLDIITHPSVWLVAAVITFAHCLSGYGNWLLFVSLLLLIVSGEMALLWSNKYRTIIEIRVKVGNEWFVLAKKECKMNRECEYFTQFSPKIWKIVALYALLTDVKLFILKENGDWDIVDVPEMV